VSNDATRPLRVAFLTNIVSPYRRPLFQQLANTANWHLRVMVNAKSEFDRDWDGACEGVDVVQPQSWSLRRTRTSKGPATCRQRVTLHLPIGLWGELSRFAPDVVIGHELGARSYMAARWAQWHHKPFLVWSYQSRASAIVGGRLRHHVRNTILKQAAVAVGMGQQARAVLQQFGVASDRIVDAANATDNQMLLTRLHQVRADGTAAALRQRLGRGKRICLVAGRLEPVKHIAGTLAMWQRLPSSVRAEWQLVFVGNGSQQHLLATCNDASVRWERAVPMSQMAGYYAASDLHLFASLADVWGLVVNEAMLAGLPTLCSTLAGCADDLIVPGQNGLLFDPSQHDAACDALRAALQRDDLVELGRAAQHTVSAFSIARLASAFRQAVHAALSHHDELVPVIR
jgi:glycosyltransferase involved in cell wall biosynthesis